MKKVLIVEDVAKLQQLWQALLVSHVEVIQALTIEEAKRKFTAHPDIFAIVVDACVPGDIVNTESLVVILRAGFAGPIIAASSCQEDRLRLIKAGCSHESSKASVPRTILTLLESLKKVLIVEDDCVKQMAWIDMLANKVEVISAFSRVEAEQTFRDNPDISAIVMDACVPGNSPNTAVLVREFRETFNGPIIATSSEAPYRQLLIRAGCDYECKKDDVPAKICEVLGLSDKKGT